MNELISVVITTYKRPLNLLKRAVDSVINQTYKNIEIIIVDDSPVDYTERNEFCKIFSDLDNRIIYHLQEKNMGANLARNKGIELSKGKYIAFLDDDDSWQSNKLEILIPKFSDNNIALVYSRGYLISKNGKKELINNELKSGNVFSALLEKNFIGGTSFAIFRAEALKEIGGFTNDLPSNQDWDVYLKIAKDYEINYSDEVLVNYYVHEGERITKNVQNKIDGWEYLYIKYKPFLSNKDLSIWELKMSYLYLKNKNILKFLNFTKRVILRTPLLFLKFWVIMCFRILRVILKGGIS